MAKVKRDTTGYTEFGLLLNELCVQRKVSFRQLAARSGMSEKSHMSIIRACRGGSVPHRDNIVAWCNVLQAAPEQREKLLHHFHYSTPEEENREQGDQQLRMDQTESSSRGDT